MNSENRVAKICAAIWGEAWVDPAARATGLNRRTLQRIKAADRDGMPHANADGVLRHLADFLSEVSCLIGPIS